MNIQYKPQDANARPDTKVLTNIGEFFPGEVRGVDETQAEEALRLIDNGDFIESDEKPNSNEIAAAMPKAMEKWTAAKAKRDEAASAASADAAPAKKSK